jgi:hypothetical protein
MPHRLAGLTALAVLLQLILPRPAAAEEITLTTYYPSPRGVYKALRVGSGDVTAPSGELHITKPDDDGAFALRVDDEAGDASPAVIDQVGNVGIGTPSPDPNAKLHVKKGATDLYDVAVNTAMVIENSADAFLDFDVPSANSAGLRMDISGDPRGAVVYEGPGAVPPRLGPLGEQLGPDTMRFWTAGAERMRIDNVGNVGIGTASPGAPLHVLGLNSGPTNRGIMLSAHNEGFEPQLTLRKSRGTAAAPTVVANGEYLGGLIMEGYDGTAYTVGSIIGTAVDGTPSGGVMPGRLEFWTDNSVTGFTEKMRITSGGNVGIGTTTPSALLHLRGVGIVQGRSAARIVVENGFGHQWFLNTWDGGVRPNQFSIGRVGVADDLTIDSAGNVGIGNSGPQSAPAPNGTAAGNLDANDVWLRGANGGAGGWASESGVAVTGTFPCSVSGTPPTSRTCDTGQTTGVCAISHFHDDGCERYNLCTVRFSRGTWKITVSKTNTGCGAASPECSAVCFR